MSYSKKPPQQALGGVGSTVVNVINAAGQAVVTAASIATDPYFPEIVCRIGQLAAVDGKRAVPPCITTPGNPMSAYGMRKVMPPLRAYAYAEAHPWVYPLAVAAVVGIPFMLGYLVAKE